MQIGFHYVIKDPTQWYHYPVYYTYSDTSRGLLQKVTGVKIHVFEPVG